MNLKLEEEFSKAPVLQEVDALKKQIDDMRPLSPEIEGRVMQKLRLEWNYNSNAIEGNKLSYGETVALIMHGITAKGKPLKDHLDIKGHNKAVEYLESMVKDERDFTESDIRGLHEVILGESYDSPAQTADGQVTYKHIQVGKYKTMPNHVLTLTGQVHYYSTPEETPAKMAELMNWYEEAKEANIHPVVIAALFHHKFVAIHPFDDGNGRMARILMNLILMRNGYPPVVIKKDDRLNYYSLLSQADTGDDVPFIEYISDRLKSSLNVYVKAINGGDIDEDEDVDKEIALLRIELRGGLIAKDKKTKESIERIFFESLLPLFLAIDKKLETFEEYFFSTQNWLRFYFKKSDKTETDLEFVGENYINKYEKILTEKNQDYYKISMDVGFKEYRNPENNFNLTIVIEIRFDNYYYSAFIGKEKIFSNLYHEVISKEQSDKTIKLVVQDFKFQLAQKKG